MSARQVRLEAGAEPQSTVLDNDGHLIKRFAGGVVVVVNARTLRPVSIEESIRVAEWYWRAVGIPDLVAESVPVV